MLLRCRKFAIGLLVWSEGVAPVTRLPRLLSCGRRTAGVTLYCEGLISVAGDDLWLKSLAYHGHHHIGSMLQPLRSQARRFICS